MMMYQSQFIEMFGSKTSGAKWPMKCLSEIVDPNCPISYGIVQPGEELEEGVPIVRPVDLNSNYYVYKDGLKRTTEAISNSYKRTILRGDELLLCVRGTTGVMGLATDELKGGNVTRGITPLYFKEGFNRIYLLGAFLSDDVQAYIKDNTVGSTLKGINMEKVRKIQIPIPPIELQNKWETVFQRADKSKFDGFKSQFTARNYFHMHETELHTKLTEAICRHTDGSRTDGKKGLQLPFPVMRFDVNLPVTDHSEVASDTDSFTRLFLTDYCEALSRASMGDYDFHKNEIKKSESKERLVIEYSIRLDKNRTPIRNEINVLLYSKHESLLPLDLNHNHVTKGTNIFE